MHKGLKTVFSLFCLFSPAIQAGNILKCVAADGSITYADTRCPAASTLLSHKKPSPRLRQPPQNMKNIEQGAEFPAAETQLPSARRVFQAKFVQALSSVSAIKIGITEYFMLRGEWPEDLEALGFDSSNMHSSLIEQVSVISQGRIQIRLVKDWGADKQIWIYPRSVMGGTQLEWICYSNFPSYDLTTGTGNSLCNSRIF